MGGGFDGENAGARAGPVKKRGKAEKAKGGAEAEDDEEGQLVAAE